jgi:hypothetical protein
VLKYVTCSGVALERPMDGRVMHKIFLFDCVKFQLKLQYCKTWLDISILDIDIQFDIGY